MYDPPTRPFDACDPGLKGRPRAEQKSQSKYKDASGLVHYEKLRDLSRLSLVFETFDGMEAMLEHMLSDDMFGGNVVRVENRYFNPTVLGWRDLQVLVRVPLARKSDAGGVVHHICEIQLQHALLADARRAAHKHYDAIRTRLAVRAVKRSSASSPSRTSAHRAAWRRPPVSRVLARAQ